MPRYCKLREPHAAQIVVDSLLHFDNDRYLMGDFVIMPNHVHCLVVFPDASQLRKQCYSWMHFTATQINRLFGVTGSFWQEEPFDHLVRSEKQLAYLRDYIAQNPINAKAQSLASISIDAPNVHSDYGRPLPNSGRTLPDSGRTHPDSGRTLRGRICVLSCRASREEKKRTRPRSVRPLTLVVGRSAAEFAS